MKKHTYLLPALLFLFFSLSSFSQSKNYIKLSIHFESNAYDLTSKHKKTISRAVDTLFNKFLVTKAFIKGNTDNVGDSAFNKKLSQQRSASVKEYLVKKRVPYQVIRVLSYGEEMPVATNENENGKLRNRRVEIILVYEPRPVVATKKPVEKKEVLPKDPCDKDTTLVLSQGSVVRINICDYHRMKGCISIQEFSNQQALINCDLTTMTSDNTALISGGMFNINLCGSDTCLKKPLTIRVPYNDSCLGDARLTLWDITVGNRWGNSTSKGLRLITEKGQKFYEFDVYCSGGKNLDVKITNYIKYNVPIHFVMKKRRLKLLEVKLAYDCPNAVIAGGKNKPHRSVSVKGFCADREPFVYAKAVNKHGDTLVMDYVPIGTLLHKNSFCNCEKATIKTGGKQVKKDEPAKFPLRRKYFLRRSDFEKVSKNRSIVRR